MIKKILLTGLLLMAAAKGISQTCDYTARLNLLRDYGYIIGYDDERKVNCIQGGIGYGYRTFYKGYTYMIVGSSDDLAVSDVDIFLYESNGSLIKKDDSTANLAVLTFTPAYTRQLKVVIKNYASSSPNFASTCRYVVAYKGE